MDTTEILSLFTADKTERRIHLREPFILNDRLCASSGHAFVATDAPVSDHYGYAQLPQEDSQKITNVLNQVIAIEQPIAFTALPTLPLTDESRIICEECQGSGDVELYNGHTHYEFECGSCNGRGYSVSWHTLPIESFYFATRYLRNAATVADRFSILDNGILCFYGDDLIGAIMPTTHVGTNLAGKGQLPL